MTGYCYDVQADYAYRSNFCAKGDRIITAEEYASDVARGLDPVRCAAAAEVCVHRVEILRKRSPIRVGTEDRVSLVEPVHGDVIESPIRAGMVSDGRKG